MKTKLGSADRDWREYYNTEDILNVHLERINTENRKKYEKFSNSFGASTAGNCWKKQWFRLNKYPEKPKDAKTNRLLYFGTLFHKTLEDSVNTHGQEWFNTDVYTEHEIHLPYKPIDVVGHLDLAIVNLTEEVILIKDYKTVNEWAWKFKFDSKLKKKSKQSKMYSLQVATYALGMLEEHPDYDVEMFLHYYNKNDSKMREVSVRKGSLIMADDYWKELNEFFDETDDEDIYNMPKNSTFEIPMEDWECRYCGYLEECKLAKGK